MILVESPAHRLYLFCQTGCAVGREEEQETCGGREGQARGEGEGEQWRNG